MEINLSQRYRFWMQLLVPLTLGIGTLALWLWAQRWPRHLDDRGILLRNGQLLRWSDIKRIGVIEQQFSDETARIDLYVKGSIIRLQMNFLANGAQISDVIRSHFRHAKR